ncbi:unnamed protein product [Spirodela intermedia]|uniref:Uncharacterized protein n=1 Tax=Spirodela intermedia TaxID=51605 RepID=A0A7I8KLK0_SPIIN|nr:unnamed protein product [Spirodela intermedia]
MEEEDGGATSLHFTEEEDGGSGAALWLAVVLFLFSFFPLALRLRSPAWPPEETVLAAI